MNHYLLLLSRKLNESHVTRAARERVHTSAYSKWYKHIYKGIVNSFSKLSCDGLLDSPINVTVCK